MGLVQNIRVREDQGREAQDGREGKSKNDISGLRSTGEYQFPTLADKVMAGGYAVAPPPPTEPRFLIKMASFIQYIVDLKGIYVIDIASQIQTFPGHAAADAEPRA